MEKSGHKRTKDENKLLTNCLKQRHRHKEKEVIIMYRINLYSIFIVDIEKNP